MAALKERWLTTGQFARRRGVHPDTVRAWIEDGHVHAEFTEAGHARIPESEVEKHMQATRAKRKKRYALDEN